MHTTAHPAAVMRHDFWARRVVAGSRSSNCRCRRCVRRGCLRYPLPSSQGSHLAAHPFVVAVELTRQLQALNTPANSHRRSSTVLTLNSTCATPGTAGKGSGGTPEPCIRRRRTCWPARQVHHSPAPSCTPMPRAPSQQGDPATTDD
eukprot:366426-Chlamydomonas_euryale.AAC.27